jgi:hypothetical protein
MCIRGYSEIQSVLKNVQDNQIRAYFVWLPVMRNDDRESAIERSKEFTDQRLSHYWDGDGLTGKAWIDVLKTGELAWDVYLLYPPSASWEKAPPAPAFWMHQLRGIEHAPHLDRSVFEAKVKELLASAK